MADGELLLSEPHGDKQPVIICAICGKNYHKYVCPRCNIAYCSKACYKSELHTKCSESFYEQEFCENLKKTKITSLEDSGHMINILRKINECDDDCSDISMDSEKEAKLRKALNDMVGGTTGPEELLDVMSEKQIEEFNKIVSGEDDSMSLVAVGKPWWIDAQVEHLERGELIKPLNNSQVIFERNCFSNYSNEYTSDALKNLILYAKKKTEQLVNSADVSLSLGSCKDSEFLLNNLIEVVSVYTYCHVYLGNDLINSLDEAAQIMLSLSPVLRPNTCIKYTTPLEAWKNFCKNLNIFEERITPYENLRAVLANLLNIISHRKKVMRTLEEIYGVLLCVSKMNKFDKNEKLSLRQSAMKIQFYYVLYRDCIYTKEWSQRAILSLNIKKEEYILDV